MYSPLGLVIFVAFQARDVAAAYAKTNATSRAWKAALNRNALAIDRRHSARRQRIAPFELRRANLPVSAAISVMFLDTLCLKKWYDMPHIGCGIHSLQRSTISPIGRHSAGYN